jgi:hypothetical protein
MGFEEIPKDTWVTEARHVNFPGLPQNLWVKKLGLCPRPQDFQGMARVSNGVSKKHPWQVGPAKG